MGRFNMLSFQQEISLMEFFSDSDYIAKLVGFCKEPVCLLMKYYPLGSLDGWVNKHEAYMGKRISATLSICGDIAGGIVVLHSREIAHCDLKPQNVLVEQARSKTRFILTDFGISKILTKEYLASEAFQISNTRGLTISYAAPDALVRFKEQKAGTPDEEKAGDVYSFGFILFFVLNIKKPW
jgi:proprotein convertase subtilisin/kexin type 5